MQSACNLRFLMIFGSIQSSKASCSFDFIDQFHEKILPQALCFLTLCNLDFAKSRCGWAVGLFVALLVEDWETACLWWLRHGCLLMTWCLHSQMFAYLFNLIQKQNMKTCRPKWVRTTEVVASFYGEATQASPPSGQQGRDGEEPVDTNLIWSFFSNWFWNIRRILNAWTAERCMVIKVLEVVVSWAMARHLSRIWLYNFKFSRR